MLVILHEGKIKVRVEAVEIEGKNMESVTAPIAWLESEGIKRGKGGNGRKNGWAKECGIWR